MEFKYSSNKNVLMLLALLKANNIKKVITSPGATHVALVASFQYDNYFEVYSAVDERGAAYMATGLAMESGEPVVICCTGATASRNYLPGLSEAFHRKLPIIAITGLQDISLNGHLIPQAIDRSVHPVDAVGMSVYLKRIKDDNDEWDNNIKINKVLLEVRRNGGTPVHIDLPNDRCNGLVVDEVPATRIIRRFTFEDELPEIKDKKKIAISIGGHKPCGDRLTKAIEAFCEKYNAVVLIDHSSNYHGKYRILPTIVTTQEKYDSELMNIDLLIHIGEETGDYYTYWKFAKVNDVWRISEDGEIRDTFKKLSNVFEMSETYFFENYSNNAFKTDMEYYNAWKRELTDMYAKLPELPFSNIWLAQNISKQIPNEAVVHLGVSNTQRAWTFFEMPNSVMSIANVGCRGIDGALSSAIGMSLANPDKIHYCILGDLTFFYDMNALGNRHVGNNLRILLINNGGGAEFNMYSHPGYQALGENVNSFVAASGHYGQLYPDLVKNYANGLNFTYLSAKNKSEVLEQLPIFLNNNISDRPILFEVFTNYTYENEALKIIRNLLTDSTHAKKDVVRNIIGDKGIKFAKKVLGK